MSFIEAGEELLDTFFEEQVEGVQEDAAKNIFERYRAWQNQVNGIDPNRSARWNRQHIISEQLGKGKRTEQGTGGRGKNRRGNQGYPSKQPATMNYPLPNETPRESSTPQVTTNADAAGGGMDVVMHNPHNSVLTSGLTSSLKYFDSHLLQSAGEKSLVRLQIKLGKQVYPDCITPFLKQLNGSGKVRMQFGGRCLAAVNTRHVHMQSFRHRLSDGVDVSVADWPTGTANRILGPNNTVPFIPAGPGATGTPGAYAVNTSSLRDITTGNCYFAPYNTADLEDLSWNLNSLKLGNPEWSAGIELPSFEPNVALFVDESHARQSRIAQNNQQIPNLPTVLNAHTAPYRYNAVFNKGSILYNFMNKGLGGAKIDLIVYRKKKSHYLNVSGVEAGSAPTFPLNQIYDSIGVGYVKTALAKSGTDELVGRPPVSTDIYTNPAFPFLPDIKRTMQSQLPFVELSRQTFAMPSGSRREVNIILPGSVYDPSNIPAGQSTTATGSLINAFPEIFDSGVFCIVMSVSGQKCTQELTEAGQSFNIGDMYAGANVQFYATYTEHMGACQYQDTPVANMYSRGALLVPDEPDGMKKAPITMLPQNQAVRIPAHSTSVGGSNLANDFGATTA